MPEDCLSEKEFEEWRIANCRTMKAEYLTKEGFNSWKEECFNPLMVAVGVTNGRLSLLIPILVGILLTSVGALITVVVR